MVLYDVLVERDPKRTHTILVAMHKYMRPQRIIGKQKKPTLSNLARLSSSREDRCGQDLQGSRVGHSPMAWQNHSAFMFWGKTTDRLRIRMLRSQVLLGQTHHYDTTDGSHLHHCQQIKHSALCWKMPAKEAPWSSQGGRAHRD